MDDDSASWRGWTADRTTYACADSAEISLSRELFENKPANVLDPRTREAVISRIRTDRPVKTLIECKNAHVFTFPRSLQMVVPGALGGEIRAAAASAGLGVFGAKSVDVCNAFWRPTSESSLRVFQDCANLAAVFLPEGLRALGPHCFCGCDLARLRIPASLAEVGEYAFYRCSRLRRVEFAAGSQLARIAENAFACSALEEFVAPASLRQIKAAAFAGCAGLERVELNAGLLEVGPLCFAGTRVKRLSLPESVAATPEELGVGCVCREVLVVRPGTRVVGYDCFASQGAEAAVIARSVRALEANVFWYPEFQRLVLEEGSQLEAIGASCFYGTALQEFVAPVSLRELADGAFCRCSQLRRVVLNEGLEVLGTGLRKNGVDQAGVFENSALREVAFPSTLRRIEHSAFAGCGGLREAGLPESLEVLGVGAFRDSGLDEFIAPPSLRTLSQGAFYQCKHLKRAVLNEGLEVLGTDERPAKGEYHGTFQDSALSTIALPSTLKRIEYCAFYGCRQLKKVALPNVLEKIGRYAFGDSGMKKFVAPPSLRVIAQGAFCDCTGLGQVELNEGLEVLGTDSGESNDFGVFQGSAVRTVRLPSTLRIIERAAFQDCERLSQLVLPDGLEKLGDNCFRQSELRCVSIPKSVQEIGSGVFQGCRHLRSIEFEDGCRLETIGANAFAGSKLEGFVAPASLREIGAAAFCGCKNLKRVELNEQLESVGWFCFSATALKELRLPERVAASKINVGVGRDYEAVMVLPEGLKEIGDMRKQAAEMDAVVVPASVRVISEEAFANLDGLRRVVFQPGSRLERIENGAFRYSGLREVKFPKSLVEIAPMAFWMCTRLQSVEFEEGSALRRVDESTFSGAWMARDVRFPAGVSVSDEFHMRGAGQQ